MPPDGFRTVCAGCPSNFFSLTGLPSSCASCDSHCATCTAATGICTACNRGYEPDNANNTICDSAQLTRSLPRALRPLQRLISLSPRARSRNFHGPLCPSFRTRRAPPASHGSSHLVCRGHSILNLASSVAAYGCVCRFRCTPVAPPMQRGSLCECSIISHFVCPDVC